MIRSIVSLLLFLGVAFSTNVHAQISCSPTAAPTFGFGKMLLPQNLPNGAVIATTTVSLDFYCKGGSFTVTPYLDSTLLSTPYPGVGNVSDGSNIGGSLYTSLGLRVTNLDTGEIINAYKGHRPVFGPDVAIDGKPRTISHRLKIDLIKIHDDVYRYTNSRLPPTISTKGFRILLYFNGNNFLNQGMTTWASIDSLTVMPETCSVRTPSVGVPLQPVATSRLGSVGATAGDRDFEIGLSCTSGSKVYVTLTDLTAPGNTSNQLSLTQTSTAKGVKLRILRNGQPVGYGPDSAMIGNTNQWYVGAASPSLTSIPLSAQYIATGPVSAGSVKGVASFTMSYQ